MSLAGGAASRLIDADARLVVAAAVTPAADNFRKVLLVGLLVTEFSWQKSVRCEYSAKYNHF